MNEPDPIEDVRPAVVVPARDNSRSPLWLQILGTLGLPAFLLLWLMGAFDGFLTSPVTAALVEHDKQTTHLLRAICYGIWRDDPGKCN